MSFIFIDSTSFDGNLIDEPLSNKSKDLDKTDMIFSSSQLILLKLPNFKVSKNL